MTNTKLRNNKGVSLASFMLGTVVFTATLGVADILTKTMQKNMQMDNYARLNAQSYATFIEHELQYINNNQSTINNSTTTLTLSCSQIQSPICIDAFDNPLQGYISISSGTIEYASAYPVVNQAVYQQQLRTIGVSTSNQLNEYGKHIEYYLSQISPSLHVAVTYPALTSATLLPLGSGTISTNYIVPTPSYNIVGYATVMAPLQSMSSISLANPNIQQQNNPIIPIVQQKGPMVGSVSYIPMYGLIPLFGDYRGAGMRNWSVSCYAGVCNGSFVTWDDYFDTRFFSTSYIGNDCWSVSTSYYDQNNGWVWFHNYQWCGNQSNVSLGNIYYSWWYYQNNPNVSISIPQNFQCQYNYNYDNYGWGWDSYGWNSYDSYEYYCPETISTTITDVGSACNISGCNGEVIVPPDFSFAGTGTDVLNQYIPPQVQTTNTSYGTNTSIMTIQTSSSQYSITGFSLSNSNGTYNLYSCQNDNNGWWWWESNISCSFYCVATLVQSSWWWGNSYSCISYW